MIRRYTITKSKAGHYTVTRKHIATGRVTKSDKLSSLARARTELASMKAIDAMLDRIVF